MYDKASKRREFVYSVLLVAVVLFLLAVFCAAGHDMMNA